MPSPRHTAANAAPTLGAPPEAELQEVRVSTALEAEVLEAMAQIDRDEYVELTHQQLDHAAATGELPWPHDESLA